MQAWKKYLIVGFFVIVLTGLWTAVWDIHTSSTEVKVRFIDSQFDDFLKPLVREIRASTSNEVYKIYMTSPGGDPVVGIDLANAIKDSPAKIYLYVDNMAASMGAILVCGYNKNSLVISNDSLILFHTMQMQNGPVVEADLPNLDAFLVAYYWKIRHYINNNCGQAFSKKEWEDMWVNGKDIIMTGKEYKNRMGIK